MSEDNVSYLASRPPEGWKKIVLCPSSPLGLDIPRDRHVLLGHWQNGMWVFAATFVTPNATIQAVLAEGHTHVAELPAWISEGP